MSNKSHLPCPYEACGSSDAFSWEDEKCVGLCHSCGRSYPSSASVFDWASTTYPVKKRSKMREPTKASYDGIRGLDPDVCKTYGIQLQSDADGPIRYAFKYPGNTKYRGYDEKKFWFKDKGGSKKLFGPEFNAGTSKRLYLTEGEFDAASLYQILGKTYPVKSIPSASISDKFIKENHDYLSVFEQIVYCGELDHAGKGSADTLYSAYPDKMWFVPMSKHKDANEFLMAGDGEELKWAALKPQRYSPDNFITSDNEVEEIITKEEPYQSFTFGHEGIDGMTRGLVKGGITFIKAPRGSGKTELFRYMEYGVLKNNEDIKIALVHMEEMYSTTYRALATYELGINVRTKQDQEENNVDIKKVVEAALKVKENDRITVFSLLPTDEPIDIVKYCRMAATIYGADFVFIDHIQRLIYRSGAENATGQLTQVATQLAELGKELNIGVIAISHVNEKGVTEYARALENEAIICINIERDTDSEDDIERNTTSFVIEKNRPFSKLGHAGKVFYDTETTILREIE